MYFGQVMIGIKIVNNFNLHLRSNIDYLNKSLKHKPCMRPRAEVGRLWPASKANFRRLVSLQLENNTLFIYLCKIYTFYTVNISEIICFTCY